MTFALLFYWLSLVAVVAPLVLFGVQGLAALATWRPTERHVGLLTQVCVVVGLLASLGMLALMLATGERHVSLELGHWVTIPHYHFEIKFVFDRLSVPFAILSYLLCGTIGAFANVYMHRELGYARFFLLFAMFLAGMVVTSLAGTIETLFAGWELVGLSSTMLVAFFHDRPAPVQNGQRVWSVYRVADAALLIAAVALHHVTGQGDFEGLMGSGPWPTGVAVMTSGQALFVGLLLLVAAAGKSALVPFSGWLPRAMEGPTPSSAIFYGALSVHLGAYLLLRVSPILALSPVLSACVVALGLITAVFAAISGRVQTDVKSALSYACLTQIGIIVVEIGLGLHYLALVHIVGHACLRTLQFLRAPTLLRDYHTLENAIGNRLPHTQGSWERRLPACLQCRLYAFGIERGYLDALLEDYFVSPFLRLFQRFDAWERRWTDWLAGGQSRESDQVRPQTSSLEDFV